MDSGGRRFCRGVVEDCGDCADYGKLRLCDRLLSTGTFERTTLVRETGPSLPIMLGVPIVFLKVGTLSAGSLLKPAALRRGPTLLTYKQSSPRAAVRGRNGASSRRANQRHASNSPRVPFGLLPIWALSLLALAPISS